jgi:prevent-host-death family protein
MRPIVDAVWQLQDAKAKLSEVIKNTVQEPQLITVRGAETAVVMSMDNYRKLVKPKPNLYEFLQNSPFQDIEINTERNRSTELRAVAL